MAEPFPFALSDQCVRCGLCLPHCPTYRASGTESEGPRGRIAIMEAVAQERIELTPIGQSHIDNCLGCARCESVCPAKVSFLEIRDHHQSLHLPTLRRCLVKFLSRPFGLGSFLALKAGSIVARLFAAVFSTGSKLAAVAASLQLLAGARPRLLHARRTSNAVSLDAEIFVGCVASSIDNAPTHSLQALLIQLGAPIPLAKAACCGALAQHAGDLSHAAAQRERIGRDAPALVALDSGCIGDLRRSGRTVHEACRFILEHWPAHIEALPLAETVAVHLPCTHQNVCGDSHAVRELLQRIPELTTVGVRGLGCCGASGLQMLTDAEHARTFAESLLAEIPATVTTLVSTNVGCRTHLRKVARAAGRQLSVIHPLELLKFK